MPTVSHHMHAFEGLDLSIRNMKHEPEREFSLCESGSVTKASNLRTLQSNLLEIRSEEF